MIVQPVTGGQLLISQSTHAMAAFALARHWGNRLTSQPAPIDEVLTAILLHDAGWDEREPSLTIEGNIAEFVTWPQGKEREALWWDTFRRAQSRGLYVTYLVGRHLLYLAETYSPGEHPAFVAQLQEVLSTLAAGLATLPRYAQILRTGQNEANVRILRVCDALSLFCCQGLRGRVAIPDAPWQGGSSALHLRPAKNSKALVHPWPFQGRHVVVNVEARFLADPCPTNQEELLHRYQQAPIKNLVFHLHPLGTGARP